MEDKTKQVIVVRTDLNMRKGKMIAQGFFKVGKIPLSSVLRGINLEAPNTRGVFV